MKLKLTKKNENGLNKIKLALVACFVFIAAITNKANAQALAGPYTIGIDYPTISAAITALNTNSISASVVINVPAGYTETVPVGGFTLTCSGVVGNTITFQKSGVGANPILTAYAGGTGTPGSAFQDGVWRLVGSDYITIDGIDITDPNITNPSTMEFGYGLLKLSATDGCQYNTIKNCVITLNRINNATGSGPAVEGSRGIDIVNALTGAHTTVVTVTSANGTNSYNMIYGNTIQNCNYGISLIGFAATTPFTNADMFNDIGGSSSATGNTIINYGGGAATNPSAAIRTLAQYNINISFNTINNNNGAGVNHATTLRGIYLNTATSANAAITNNTLTINGGATTSQVSAIENNSGSTAASNTITISNNVIQNSTYATATSGNFYCILNGATPAVLTYSANAILNNNLAGTGTFYGLETGSPTSANVLSNLVFNNIRNAASSTSGTSYCLKTTSPATLTVNSNTVDLNGFSTLASTGSVYGFYGFSSSVNVILANNIIRNLSVAGAGAVYGIREWGVTGNKVIQNNQIYSFTSAAGASMYGINVSVGTITITGNTINSLNSTGGTAGSFYGIYISSSTPTTTINKNKIYDISSGSTNPSLFGMNLNAGINTVYNNVIGDLRTPVANAAIPLGGIYVSGGTTTNLFYNTVMLNGTSSGALFGSSALYASTTPNLNLRNNILINLSTPNGATGFSSAYRRSSTTLTTYSASSNNNIFYAGTPSTNNLIMYDGTNSYQTLAAYQTAVGTRDANSASENSPFLSTVGSAPTFLHLDPSLPSAAESGAVNIAGITDDYDTDIRQGNPGYTGSGLAPDMGADEYNQILPGCTTASGGTQSTTSYTRCAGQTVSLNSAGFTTGSGVTYQWQVSTTPSGPYSNVIGGTGANTPAYTSGTLTAGTYYYVLLTTCTITSVTGTSNESTVTVNPIPTASATSNSPLCSGQTLNLTGGSDVGTNFTWTGPASFTVQNPSASASSSLSGTYTLVVSAAGCTATPVSVTVTITTTPSNLTVTPTSTSLCAGASQTITGMGGDVDKTMAFGTQANQNGASTTATGYPAPYSAYYGGQKMQILILASELTANGFAANSPIRSIQFPVVSKGSNWGGTINDLKSYQVNIGATAITDITAYQTGLTNVVAPMNFTPSVGYNNVHTFSSPFIWNGTSNIVIETTWSNSTTNGTNDLVVQYNSPTTFTSCVVTRADAVTAVAMSATTGINFTYMSRPDFKLNGSGPAPFSWSPASSLSSATSLTTVATPTANTDYTLTATNGVCTSTAAVSLTVSPLPIVSVAATPTAICAGGSASLTASGATTYSWSTGGTSSSINVTPSVTATYTVDGTNACGTDTKTISVNVNPTPTITAVSNPTAICAGASATVTASGASTYTMNTTSVTPTFVLTPSVSISYTLAGTDANGCIGVTFTGLMVNSNPTVNAVSSTSAVCAGTSATLTASGANTYTWTSVGTGSTIVVTPTTNTTYTVDATNANGCMGTQVVSVNTNSLPVISANTSASVLCTGSSATLTASGANTYSWTSVGAGASVVVSPTTTTTYTVEGTDVNGCTDTISIQQTVSLCTGINGALVNIKGVSIYPNPSNGLITLMVTDATKAMHFEVYDAVGKIVVTKEIITNETQINLSELANGIYSYSLVNSNGSVSQGKLVKQ